MTTGGWRTVAVPSCRLCGTAGETLYEQVEDRLFGLPGSWRFRVCPTDGLCWLDPRPHETEFDSLYPPNYYTRKPSPRLEGRFARNWDIISRLILKTSFGYPLVQASPWTRPFAWLVSAVPAIRDRAGAEVMWLRRVAGGTVLDVGCGSGELLARLQDRGWSATGLDTDPIALMRARDNSGIAVIHGTIDDISPDRRFDAVTLSHVIEHVPDPVTLMRGCWNLLRPGGTLVVLTPNFASLGHRVFRNDWPLLDPPRHLQLFTRGTILQCAAKAGIPRAVARTICRGAVGIFCTATALRAGDPIVAGRPAKISDATRLRGLGFLLIESALADAGEETVLIATKTRNSVE